MTEKNPLKLLCVTAHPDDECFGFGGALMLAAERGIETSVLCFTDGQAATNRGTATTHAELGQMRRAESSGYGKEEEAERKSRLRLTVSRDALWQRARGMFPQSRPPSMC
jgi:hypothetical protein